MARPFEIIPVRLIGARAWHLLAGDSGLRKLTEAARKPPLSLLKDEYFVVAVK